MAKIVVTFKLEEEIYSKLKEIAQQEGRGGSEILRESLTDWLQNKKYISTPDFITFILPSLRSKRTSVKAGQKYPLSFSNNIRLLWTKSN